LCAELGLQGPAVRFQPIEWIGVIGTITHFHNLLYISS
jgi:hypothetical protein